MRAGGDFGNNAAECAVMIFLTSQGMAQNRPVGTHNCRCGFVAAGFKTKDDCHCAFP